MTVTQLAAYIKGVFDDEELLHDVTLSGEVAEVSYSGKHTFVVLAEGDVSVRCVHFFARDGIQKGSRVAMRGSVRFYDKRGTVSFSYTEFFVCGDGAKAIELEKLKNKLKGLGYFENRPQLPRYVLDVVAVTSPEGAAIRDFIRVVGDRAPFVRIRVYPVKVQGAGAARQMADAVKKLDGKCGAIVLCRGGGSDEDLDCFNDEELATAVALSKTPVISAVGHEVDYTLCDFCAGTRAGTPSIAGQIVAAHAAALTDDMALLMTRAWNALLSRYETRRAALDRLGAHVTGAIKTSISGFERKTESLARRGQYAVEKKLIAARHGTEHAAAALKAALDKKSEAAKKRLDKLAAVLDALDPHKIRQGYAAVFLNGRSVAGAGALAAGDEIKLEFFDGEATATVKSAKKSKRRT